MFCGFPFQYNLQTKVSFSIQETAIDLVKKVLGDYGREVVLLLSGTNTAFQVMDMKASKC